MTSSKQIIEVIMSIERRRRWLTLKSQGKNYFDKKEILNFIPPSLHTSRFFSKRLTSDLDPSVVMDIIENEVSIRMTKVLPTLKLGFILKGFDLLKKRSNVFLLLCALN